MKTCKKCGASFDDNCNVCPSCGESLVAESNVQFTATEPNTVQNIDGENSMSQPVRIPLRSAYVAAFLAIILGAFGVHNFYLDKTKKAVIQLIIGVLGTVVTFGVVFIVMEIWAIVEAVKLLKGEINTDGRGLKIKLSF